MKLRLFILALVCTLIGIHGFGAGFGYRVNTTVNINGVWSAWTSRLMEIAGSPKSLQIGLPLSDPWDYTFKFTISNYHTPSKEEIKRHFKNKEWYTYSGTVEYWVSDNYPTIEEVFRVFKWPAVEQTGSSKRAKRTATATIKIEPYKKEPRVYNIFFDGVGFGIDLR